MRRWVTGVSIVTSQSEGYRHGMTVNSFVSISIEPPLVAVTLAVNTRTHSLVKECGYFGVSILSSSQSELSDIFAGRILDGGDRFAGVESYTWLGKAPLIEGGLAGLECRVVHEYPMPNSTLFVGEVLAAGRREEGDPLVYVDRGYHALQK